MSNLLDLVKDQIGSAVIGKVASVMGVNEHLTRSAVDSFLPAVLSGVIDQGSTRDGASNLLSLINSNNLGSGVLDNIGSLLGGGSKTDTFLKMGSGLISALFGGNQSGLIDKLLSIGGLSRGNSGKLLSILAPIAMSVIGKLIKSKNMNAGGLLSFLQGEKSVVSAALPAGFSAFSGGSSARTSARTEDDNGGGMGWLKWLIPLLLVAALAWYFLGRKGTDGMEKTPTKIEQSYTKPAVTKATKDHAGHDHAGHDHAGHDHAGHDHGKTTTTKATTAATDVVGNYRIDPKGNIIDKYGFVVYSAADIKKDNAGNIVDPQGKILIPVARIKSSTVKLLGKSSPKLNVDASGNLVDGSGKILFKKGEYKVVDGYYVDNAGNRLGFFSKVGKAIGNAAEKTADAFKSIFTGIFAKSNAAGSTYNVSRMDFNKENHRLTYYSKQEFEGLVAALNAYPNKNLEVRVYTDDGKNDKANKKLSDARANVVRDMLTTLLGTHKKQVSFKGMGSSDANKAAKDVVEIFVAK